MFKVLQIPNKLWYLDKVEGLLCPPDPEVLSSCQEADCRVLSLLPARCEGQCRVVWDSFSLHSWTKGGRPVHVVTQGWSQNITAMTGWALPNFSPSSILPALLANVSLLLKRDLQNIYDVMCGSILEPLKLQWNRKVHARFKKLDPVFDSSKGKMGFKSLKYLRYEYIWWRTASFRGG